MSLACNGLLRSVGPGQVGASQALGIEEKLGHFPLGHLRLEIRQVGHGPLQPGFRFGTNALQVIPNQLATTLSNDPVDHDGIDIRRGRVQNGRARGNADVIRKRLDEMKVISARFPGVRVPIRSAIPTASAPLRVAKARASRTPRSISIGALRDAWTVLLSRHRCSCGASHIWDR
jgi:hypothetical protein